MLCLHASVTVSSCRTWTFRCRDARWERNGRSSDLEPPCIADEDDPNERDKDAQRLLRKMLAAGISRYDPDPLAALEKAGTK
jgi:hypothetical protein